MPKMEYKDERSADLRLHLFRGAVDLEAFPVLVRRALSIRGLEIDACIIGASHAVQFRAGDEIVTEVLACRTKGVDRFEEELRGVWRLGEDVRSLSGSPLGYSFDSELAPLDAARSGLARLRERIAKAEGEGSIGLAFQFPSGGGELPETLLHVAARPGGWTVRSAHVYPQEEIAVLSRTILEAPSASAVSAPSERLLEVAAR